MNQLAGAGVDPAAVDPARSSASSSRRGSGSRAKAFDEALARAGDPGFSADPYLAQTRRLDIAELEPLVDRILAANPGQVERTGGKQGLLGFFVGQVMKETGAAPTRRSSPSSSARSSVSDCRRRYPSLPRVAAQLFRAG